MLGNPWLRLILLCLLLSLALTPFAGLFPLMLILLISGLYWLVGMVHTILVGLPEKPEIASQD